MGIKNLDQTFFSKFDVFLLSILDNPITDIITIPKLIKEIEMFRNICSLKFEMDSYPLTINDNKDDIENIEKIARMENRNPSISQIINFFI